MKREFHIFIVLFLSIVVSFYSCTKEPQFVAGEVLFQAYDSTSFFSASQLFDSLQLKIKVAYNYEYLIRTTADSVDTIRLILKSKLYLTNGGITFGLLYLKDTLHVTANFFDLDITEVNDWFYTIAILNLKENLKGNFFKWGTLLVPQGQEQHWVDELKNYSITKEVQLNHVWY